MSIALPALHTECGAYYILDNYGPHGIILTREI